MSDHHLNNVVELHGREEREIQASEWIARLERGLTREETDSIRRWLASDTRNRELLSEMASMWDDMDVLSRLSELFPKPVHEDSTTRKRRFIAAASGFAVLAAVLVSLFLANQDVGDSAAGSALTESATYQTAVGGLTTVQLSDGSGITLNTDSLIHVEFSPWRRVIRLQRGEIHVEVAHDASRPMSVLAGDRIIEAVGTAFTIKIDQDQHIELLVTDGKVRVGAAPADIANTVDQAMADSLALPSNALAVSTGERFMLGNSDERLEKLESDDIHVRLSWREGNLIFRGESLGEATGEISRYSPVDFVFVNDDLKDVRVAGLFKTGDVSGFLASLEANLAIEYQRLDDRTIQLRSSGGVSD